MRVLDCAMPQEADRFSPIVQDLPISLLELNTFGHAVCTILIYLIWWEKPFEVDFPTVVSSQILWNTCALDCLRHYSSPAVHSMAKSLKDTIQGLQTSRDLEEVRPFYFVPLSLQSSFC